MSRKFNKKRLGRLGEKCCSRVLRDAWGTKIFTQGEETYMPGFDLEAIKTKNDETVSLWVQVKSTAINYREGFKLHYRDLKKIQRVGMQLVKQPDKWAICGVVFERKELYIWTQNSCQQLIQECEANVGDVISPGMQTLEYANAARAFPLTADELSEYEQILCEFERPKVDPDEGFFD